MGRPLYSLRSRSAEVAFRAATGHLENPRVFDWDVDPEPWYENGVDISAGPRSVPLGHTVRAHCTAYSDTGDYFLRQANGLVC